MNAVEDAGATAGRRPAASPTVLPRVVSLSAVPLFSPALPAAALGATSPPTPTSDVRSPVGVDWSLVVTLRRRAAAEISAGMQEHHDRHGTRLSAQDRIMMGRSVIGGIVRQHAEQLSMSGAALWPISLERQYARALEDGIFGYGRLQPLLEVTDAENIEINGCGTVRVQYADGRRTEMPPVADSDEELVEAIRFLGESATPTRPFDDMHPTMTLALGDRFRLHAIGFGLSHRPSVTIRQHLLTAVTLRDLVARDMLPAELARFLHAAVLARKSIIVAGDQGSGKTTLLRGLVAAIPRTERFGTIETDYELLTHLQPGRENVVALQARVGMGELQDGRRLGEVTVADLIPEALRQNLMRIVVGEVRGDEAGAMFEAMAAGAGTLATTHSHSSASIMDRLASRVAQGGVLTIPEAYRQIAHNVDLLVHIRLTDDTWRGGRRRRYVSEVRQVTGAIENDRPTTHLTYATDADGVPVSFHPDAGFWADLAPFDHAWSDPRYGGQP
ncbi:MAG TPA: CpaF/VirB11 family protein [Propionibacteriaceae bacterium]|nr:CpaF/VirB11 family protein [Propionibacteriaceae bacterium]HQE32776.1 CpaF/VirB11 family protein [Propionibacteriaceae bacterium]